MEISGMVRSSLIDYPGCISIVLFTQGCNYDCFYCHNRQLIANGGGSLDIDAVLEFLRFRRGLVEGVVATGGEPTLVQHCNLHCPFHSFKGPVCKI